MGKEPIMGIVQLSQNNRTLYDDDAFIFDDDCTPAVLGSSWSLSFSVAVHHRVLHEATLVLSKLIRACIYVFFSILVPSGVARFVSFSQFSTQASAN